MQINATATIPIIAGPTASGKTAVAVKLAHAINGEIISADSMQVYRHLSIGTAKPTYEELEGVPCHLIDHVSPDEQYQLARFVSEAQTAIKQIRSRGKQPIICGGTGLYIRGLLYGIFSGGEADLEIRRKLNERYSKSGLSPLFDELKQVDPVAAERYGPNDRQRILRALEVYQSTGKPLSTYHQQDIARPVIPAQLFVLSHPRAILYERINRRVDKMVEDGLLDEVRTYLAEGWDHQNPAVKALGYRELIGAIEHDLPVTSAIELMKQKSRNYAKRQETWFRSMKDSKWIQAEDRTSDEICEVILSNWKSAHADVSA